MGEEIGKSWCYAGAHYIHVRVRRRLGLPSGRGKFSEANSPTKKSLKKEKRKNNPDGRVRERGALDGGNGARKYVSKGRAWLVLYV
jgi:hypothetical protein